MKLSLLARKSIALAVCLSLGWTASAAELARTAPEGAPIALAAPAFHQELSLKLDALVPQNGAPSLGLPVLAQLRAQAWSDRRAPAASQEAARAQAAGFVARVLTLDRASAKAELEQAGVPQALAARMLAAQEAAQRRAGSDPAYAAALARAVQPPAVRSRSAGIVARAERLARALKASLLGRGAELAAAAGPELGGLEPAPGSGGSGRRDTVSADPSLSGSPSLYSSGAGFVPSAKKVGDLFKLEKNDPEAAFAMASGILADASEPRVEVRASALRALRPFPAERTLPILIRIAAEPGNWYIQRMAAQLVGERAAELGPQRGAAEKALREAYKSSNPSVRLMARASLEKMGVDAGPEPAPKLVDVVRGRVPSPMRVSPQSPQGPPQARKPSLARWIFPLVLMLAFFMVINNGKREPTSPSASHKPAITQTVKPEQLKTTDDAVKQIAQDLHAERQILEKQEADRLAEKAKKEAQGGSVMLGVLFQIAMAIFPIILLVWLFKKMQGGGVGSAMKQANQTNLNLEKPNVRFSDVAGIDDSLLEVQQIIDYLKNPQIYTKLGAKPPKGVLLEGPPGTGKTLLARALAGEANANFISMRGSDFIQLFVGVGAARVRELFETARRNAPTIVFIDEIDAVGKARGHENISGGSSEHDQTLVALLGELDGFTKMDNVVVIAATNRADVLDPALMRPGRFDRKIYVGNPDVLGREAILAVHGAKVRLGPDADLTFAARRTPGLSGAAMANIINESALQGARNQRDAINEADLMRAVDKETFGDQRHLFVDDATKERVAWHESGHALAGMLAGESNGRAPNKITIIPHGSAALGYAEPAQEGDGADSYLSTQEQLEARLVGIMGGRAAEEIVYGGKKGISTGPGSDIEQADRVARAMVEKLGMDEKVGILVSGADPRNPFAAPRTSPETQREIDVAVRTLISKALEQAKALFAKPENRAKLEAMVKALKERETIYGPEIEEIVRGKKS